jgi:hypothetical protein
VGYRFEKIPNIKMGADIRPAQRNSRENGSSGKKRAM